MVTRSIVGRFLILAVLIVSLGVIAQAALIMTQNGDRKAAVKTAAAQPGASDTADGAPVRVVYPGLPVDASAQPRKAAEASASPVKATPFGQPAAPIVQPLASVQASTAAAPATDIPASPPAVIQPVANAPVVDANPPIAPQPVGEVQAAPPAPAAAPPPAAAPAAAPVVVASIDPGMSLPDKPAPPAHAADGAPSSKGININRASAAVLDRLRGGGRIGQTIVEHRPYRSVEDLVRKRVLRRSVYEQIKRQIAAQ